MKNFNFDSTRYHPWDKIDHEEVITEMVETNSLQECYKANEIEENLSIHVNTKIDNKAVKKHNLLGLIKSKEEKIKKLNSQLKQLDQVEKIIKAEYSQNISALRKAKMEEISKAEKDLLELQNNIIFEDKRHIETAKYNIGEKIGHVLADNTSENDTAQLKEIDIEEKKYSLLENGEEITINDHAKTVKEVVEKLRRSKR